MLKYMLEPVEIKHPGAWVVLSVALFSILLALAHLVRNGSLVMLTQGAYIDDLMNAAFYGYVEGAEACRIRGGYTIRLRQERNNGKPTR